MTYTPQMWSSAQWKHAYTSIFVALENISLMYLNEASFSLKKMVMQITRFCMIFKVNVHNCHDILVSSCKSFVWQVHNHKVCANLDYPDEVARYINQEHCTVTFNDKPTQCLIIPSCWSKSFSHTLAAALIVLPCFIKASTLN